MTIAELNNKFGIPGNIKFYAGPGDLPMIDISNQFANCIISIYGAQLISYHPVNEKEILWMSDKSLFEEGKAIRGGIPICFPWFGPHATDTLLPQHGFARLFVWEVAKAEMLENGASLIHLHLHHSPATKAFWPFEFSASLSVTVGVKMDVKLSITNAGDAPFNFTDALHSYFNVSDIKNISIEGLYKTGYYEANSNELKVQQEALLNITKEENRRYVDQIDECIIHDNGFNRKIRVSKTGSKVTVVWNPGGVTAKNIADISDEGYKTFICVEAANALTDVVALAPGQQFAVSATIGLG